MAKATKKVVKKRREKKNIEKGAVHIQSTFNNTIVTITDVYGNAISWASAGELGFKGAVISDALIMGGNATGDLVKETVQAFKAGADILLWPPVEAADEIERQILSGEIPMSRLDDALARIERMESFRMKALEEKTLKNL